MISEAFKGQFSPDCQLALTAAEAAGIRIREIYARDFSVREKENNEGPVTEADVASNQVISEILNTSGYPILSEETADSADRLNAEKVWIVDPIDGTQDFIDHNDEFTVLIGLVDNGIPAIGIVYQPARERYFIAEKGRGAFLVQDNKLSKIGVSKTDDFNVAEALVSRNHLSAAEKEFLGTLGLGSEKQTGSCGLKIAELARGSADIYFSFTRHISQWDTSAGHCLITEAGGAITDTRGQPLLYNTAVVKHPEGIVVTNGVLHNRLIEAIRHFYSLSS